jgi:hypothetical protein
MPLSRKFGQGPDGDADYCETDGDGKHNFYIVGFNKRSHEQIVVQIGLYNTHHHHLCHLQKYTLKYEVKVRLYWDTQTYRQRQTDINARLRSPHRGWLNLIGLFKLELKPVS